jgi:hypothetical protein
MFEQPEASSAATIAARYAIPAARCRTRREIWAQAPWGVESEDV